MTSTPPDWNSNEAKLLYCGSEGIGIGTALRGFLRGAPSELPDWPQLRDRAVLPTFLGRTAVWQLCRIWNLGPGDEILMPAYNCGTEVDPFIVSGCKVVLYRVDERTNIDVEDIIRRKTDRTKVVYVTHYFGWPQNLDELLPWCRRHGLRLVEDCALSLFSNGPKGPLGTLGDAAIFSLGKFLPVPSGGLLTLRPVNGMNLPTLENWPIKPTLRKTVALLRKDIQRKLESIGLYSVLRKRKLKKRDDAWISTTHASLRPDMPNDYYLEETLQDKHIPTISLRIASQANVARIVTQRRANYFQLQQNLEAHSILKPLFDEAPEGTCPMVFPALASDRKNIVRFLEDRGVCCYPFWEGYHQGLTWDEFPEAQGLKNHLITLPVNQSLSVDHMDFVSSLVRTSPPTNPCSEMVMHNI
ncbi:MAG: DegT/DnrJ/EryC1/StrS family aminotransferase [Verrucomicrobiota bacterium]